jgi:hypothetical protein
VRCRQRQAVREYFCALGDHSWLVIALPAQVFTRLGGHFYNASVAQRERCRQYPARSLSEQCWAVMSCCD